VVCAFKASHEQTAELRALGVRDSKQLRDSQIIQIATSLYQQFPGRMSGIVLKPSRYNQIMDDMKSNSRNLNDLLAWQHCGVIQNLLSTETPVDGVLVDQFSKSKKVAAAFKTKQPDLRVVERSGAESDLAVAAASILARYQFLGAMKELSKRYKIDLPLGAGSNVDKAAREFVKLHGLDRLNEVAKLHFKNTLRVQATPAPYALPFVSCDYPVLIARLSHAYRVLWHGWRVRDGRDRRMMVIRAGLLSFPRRSLCEN
jgi:ribonuclease HIII